MKNGFSLTHQTLLVILTPFIFIIFSFIYPVLLPAGLAINVLLLLILLFDLVLSPDYKKKLLIKIDFPRFLNMGRYNDFDLLICNQNKLALNFYFLFDLDSSFERGYEQHLITVKPEQEKKISLKLFPRRRGFFQINEYYIKARSWWGFFYFYIKYPVQYEVNVVPTTYARCDKFKMLQKQIKKYEGYQKNKRIGEGTDFEMLRDYSQDDEYNLIDWKATARSRRPITRVYRIENNFEIALMIDCGRLMATEADHKSLLDYAINSAIVLAHAAVKGNDSISLTAFCRTIIRYLPPCKEIKSVKKLNHMLTDLQYQFAESDYKTGLSFISTKLGKRSLIVIFTDIIDDSNLKIYQQYFSILKKKHLILLVLLRDRKLFNTAKARPGLQIPLEMKAAAADLIGRRQKTIHHLKRLGIEILDLFPEQVTAKTLNKYLSLKHKN